MNNKRELILRLISNWIPIASIKKSFRTKYLNNKSYALNSGERQVGTTIDAIRNDHVLRYNLASNIINGFYQNKKINGLDVFCGNGYGSYILSKNIVELKKLISIDGSKDAINLAKKYYKNAKISYKHKLFPFKLTEKSFDFIISMESIEHIEDDISFVKTLSKALKENGLFILSTPNEAKQSLAINPNKFHYRHYMTSEMIQSLNKYNLELMTLYGQDVYLMDNNGVCTGILKDSEMGLKENYDGQFIIYVLKKNSKTK